MNFQALAQQCASYHNSRTATLPRTLTRLGGGSFGAAYLHKPTGLVLKVGYTLSDGSMGFISKCAEYWQRHEKAPEYCPRVFEFKKCAGYWYAVLELVEQGQMPEGMWDELQEKFGGLNSDAFGEYLAKVSGGVANIRDKFDRTYICTDLHSGNYGTADDGRFVVFDPFAASVHVKKFRAEVRAPRTYGPHFKGGRYAR